MKINDLKKTQPNLKVGIVAFNHEVTVIGDGM
jgi:hypothetical protein